MSKNGIHGKIPRRKPQLTKKEQSCLAFDDPWDFSESILWIVKSKQKILFHSSGLCLIKLLGWQNSSSVTSRSLWNSVLAVKQKDISSFVF